MTVLSCLHDSVTGAGIIYITLENPNGFPEMHVFNDGKVRWYPEEGGRKWLLFSDPIGLFYLDDALSTDTRLHLICHSMCIYETNEMSVFFMDSEDGITFSLPEVTQMKQLSFADGDIILTPIGFSCNQRRFSVSMTDLLTIMIRYRDGAEKAIVWYDPNIKQGRFGRKKTKDPIQNYVFAPEMPEVSHKYRSFLLNFIIDIDQVHSVVINDEEFFVE